MGICRFIAMKFMILCLALGAVVTALPTTAEFDFPKVPEFSMPSAQAGSSKLPTVFMHGMGDSCFNSGMKSITEAVGKHLGTYSVCIPTGPDLNSDTNNGFFMTMNDNVDVFAKAIANDTNLSQGFNAIGFSQGNSVVRGYIQKYNSPPISTFLSVHGTVVGVASFPKCDPSGPLGKICKLLDQYVVGPFAYTKFVQGLLFQADYFRDPKQINSTAYKTNSALAKWNNEGIDGVDASIKVNFGRTKRYAMIKAEKDTMIYPNDGEWWGAFAADGVTRLSMKETEWYKKDLFGLKTADEAGKIFFNSTTGDHLQFTEEQLMGWVDQYFLE